MEGWIKLHRSCLGHWLYTEYRPLTRREAWETILFTVNFEPSKSIIKGQLYLCDRGQSLLSLQSWADKFVWSIQQVRTFFKLLENDKMILLEGLQYTTRLTVCNYAIYQDQQQTANRPLTDGQQTANKPLTTIKEGEERKELKKNKNIVIPSFEDFLSYAKEKEPLACERSLKLKYEAWKVNGWKTGNDKQIKNWKSTLLNTLPHIDKTKSSNPQQQILQGQNAQRQRTLNELYKKV